MTWFMILAAVLALGLVRGWRLAFPPRVDMAAKVARYDKALVQANRRLEEHSSDKVVQWVLDWLARSGRDLTGTKQDLEITETPLEDHMSKVIALGICGLIGGLVVGIGWPRMLHLNFPPVLALFSGAGFAVGGVWLITRELRKKAEEKRAEMRRALSSWLDLIAMSLEGGSGHAEALPAAASVGTGWAFNLLQEATIVAPRYQGIPAWTALGRLGQRIGMKELTELEGILTLAQRDGNRVKATLIARANTLREARNADVEASAKERTESMQYTLWIPTFAFLALEFYPPLSRIWGGN